jgi:hypothetical protein
MSLSTMEEILNEIDGASLLSKRCAAQPSYRKSIIARCEFLTLYYQTLSQEALEGFNRHLSHLKNDPNQYVKYDNELRFAQLLVKKGIPNRFLLEGNTPTPDIEAIVDGEVMNLEVYSNQEDELSNVIEHIEETIEDIPSGHIVRLDFPGLDSEGDFPSRLALINQVEAEILEALGNGIYRPIRREEYEVEFIQDLTYAGSTEFMCVRGMWNKTDWLLTKAKQILAEKAKQLESKPHTTLLWWNSDPRLFDFEKALPEALKISTIPYFSGILLVDKVLGFASFPTPAAGPSELILTHLREKLKASSGGEVSH